MIGMITREVVKDPKKDVTAAILPNGRVLVNPDWVRNPENSEEKPDPEGQRKFLEDYLEMFREGLQAQGEQTPRTDALITLIGDRLNNHYNKNYLLMVYDDSPDKSLGLGPWHPTAEAKDLIKKKGLR